MAAVPGLFQFNVQLTGGVGTGPFMNVWYVASGGTGDIAQINTIGTAFANFYTAIKALFGSGISVSVPSKVVNLSSDPGILVGATSNVVASTGANVAPAQLAAVISLTSVVAARKGRGRKFIGPLASVVPSSSTGDLSSANQTTIQTAANALKTAVEATTGGWNLAIPNRQPDPPHDLTGFTPVNGLVVRSHIYTQRRRGF